MCAQSCMSKCKVVDFKVYLLTHFVQIGYTFCDLLNEKDRSLNLKLSSYL